MQRHRNLTRQDHTRLEDRPFPFVLKAFHFPAVIFSHLHRGTWPLAQPAPGGQQFPGLLCLLDAFGRQFRILLALPLLGQVPSGGAVATSCGRTFKATEVEPKMGMKHPTNYAKNTEK